MLSSVWIIQNLIPAKFLINNSSQLGPTSIPPYQNTKEEVYGSARATSPQFAIFIQSFAIVVYFFLFFLDSLTWNALAIRKMRK